MYQQLCRPSEQMPARAKLAARGSYEFGVPLRDFYSRPMRMARYGHCCAFQEAVIGVVA